MITLSVAEVMALHEKLVAATGGSPGIRDVGLLESAVLGIHQSFGGTGLYPGIVEKSARISYAICKNHPFVDGNKRVAVTAMLVTLRLNGIVLSYTQKELIDLGLGIADSGIGYDEIVAWLNKHIM